MIGREFLLQIRRGRTWIAYGTLMAIPVLMGLALKLGGGPEANEGPPFLAGATENGIFLSISAVAATSRFFLVVVAALFLGESVAAESSWGSERYALIRPVPRLRYLWGKVVIGAALIVGAIVAVALVGLGAGWVLFGLGPLRFLGLDLSIGEALVRLGIQIAYIWAGLLTVGAISLLVAVISESSAGAVIAAVGVGVVSQILDAIGALGDVRRFLPTHYWDAWIQLFRPDAPLDAMATGLLLGFGYVVALGLLTFARFATKDITS